MRVYLSYQTKPLLLQCLLSTVNKKRIHFKFPYKVIIRKTI